MFQTGKLSCSSKAFSLAKRYHLFYSQVGISGCYLSVSGLRPLFALLSNFMQGRKIWLFQNVRRLTVHNISTCGKSRFLNKLWFYNLSSNNSALGVQTVL
jgi:hypothetical protein